jgi:hypothetical protein
VASGWGLGLESFTGFQASQSWPHYFANLANANQLWNISLPSKPVDLIVRDQIGFCKDYIASGRHPNDLMCLIEFLLPANPFLAAVVETPTELVFPILMHNDPAKHTTLDTEWTEFFVSTPKTPQYLKQDLYTPVKINASDKDNYRKEKYKYFANHHSFSNRMVQVREQIHKLQRWLSEHGFGYMMFWAGGNSNNFHRIVDRSIMPGIPEPHRYIQMQEFTIKNWLVVNNIKTIKDHPDRLGHKLLAEYIYKQASRRAAWPKAQLIQV